MALIHLGRLNFGSSNDGSVTVMFLRQFSLVFERESEPANQRCSNDTASGDKPRLQSSAGFSLPGTCRHFLGFDPFRGLPATLGFDPLQYSGRVGPVRDSHNTQLQVSSE